MRTTCLPDPQSPSLHAPPCPEKGWPNFACNARSRSIHYPPRWGPLSIKCVMRGEEAYEVGTMRAVINADSYMILNTDQWYASYIDTEEETEIFTVFFNPAFADQAFTSLLTAESRLMEEPETLSARALTFMEGPHPYNNVLASHLCRLYTISQQAVVTPGWYEEHFYYLLEQMLHTHRGISLQIEGLQAKRLSTRLELYERLQKAREFIADNYRETIYLADMAREAFLAPHHFLRLFRQAFHETPHQYLTRTRLEAAHKLLATTEMSVTDLCFELGFESLGSFSNLFSRYCGLSPSRFRRSLHQTPGRTGKNKFYVGMGR